MDVLQFHSLQMSLLLLIFWFCIKCCKWMIVFVNMHKNTTYSNFWIWEESLHLYVYCYLFVLCNIIFQAKSKIYIKIMQNKTYDWC